MNIIKKASLVLVIFVSAGISALAQEMSKASLLNSTAQALGIPVLDTARTLKYDLILKSGDIKQELAVVTKGKRKIVATSQNPANPVEYVRNGANYFIRLNGQVINLASTDSRRNLNGYNFFRGMNNLIKAAESTQLMGQKEINGTDYWHLKEVDGKVTTHLFIDPVTFLPFRKRTVRRNDQGEVKKLVVINYSDYVAINGVTLPGKQRISLEQSGQTTIQVIRVSNIEIGIEVANDIFMAQ